MVGMKVVYIVREGLERGLGRYMGRGAGADWKESRGEAMRFAHAVDAFRSAVASVRVDEWRVVKVKLSAGGRVFTQADVEKLARNMFRNCGRYGDGVDMGGWWLNAAENALQELGKAIP
jgi:hypothetical protein